jgi:hypothetical protein
VKPVPKDKFIFCAKLLEWVGRDIFRARRSWAPWILMLEVRKITFAGHEGYKNASSWSSFCSSSGFKTLFVVAASVETGTL